MGKETYQISKDGITAGIVVEDGVVVKCAPIVKWTKGQIFEGMKVWLWKNGFDIKKVED